ncbi:MAG: ABC transporter permease [Bacteroidota bacterium]
MALPLFVAKRYIKSKKTSRFLSLISAISIAGIALGVATLIIALTVLNGFEKTITNKIIEFNSHIQITSFSNRILPDYRVIRPVLEKRLSHHATGISPFAARLAIIKAKRHTEGVTVKGILKKYDVSGLSKYIVSGSYSLDSLDGLPAIVVGKKLADKLFLSSGDKVTLFTLKNYGIPSPDNPPGIEQFRVRGIFESSMAEYDDQFAYVDLPVAQQLFGMNNGINGYDIKLNDITRADSLSQNLALYLGYPYYPRTIYTIYENIFTWIDLQKKLVPISLILIVIVAAFNIIGTLLMIVLEKTNAIGILKSLGASRRQVISVFMLQGIYISFIGIIIGNIFAYLVSFIQDRFGIITLPEAVYYMSKAPIDIRFTDYVLVSLGSFLLCMLASLIPSYIASKVNTISSLRFS